MELGISEDIKNFELPEPDFTYTAQSLQLDVLVQ